MPKKGKEDELAREVGLKIRITEGMRRQLKARAAVEGRAVQSVIVGLIQKYLDSK